MCANFLFRRRVKTWRNNSHLIIHLKRASKVRGHVWTFDSLLLVFFFVNKSLWFYWPVLCTWLLDTPAIFPAPSDDSDAPCCQIPQRCDLWLTFNCRQLQKNPFSTSLAADKSFFLIGVLNRISYFDTKSQGAMLDLLGDSALKSAACLRHTQKDREKNTDCRHLVGRLNEIRVGIMPFAGEIFSKECDAYRQFDTWSIEKLLSFGALLSEQHVSIAHRMFYHQESTWLEALWRAEWQRGAAYRGGVRTDEVGTFGRPLQTWQKSRIFKYLKNFSRTPDSGRKWTKNSHLKSSHEKNWHVRIEKVIPLPIESPAI